MILAGIFECFFEKKLSFLKLVFLLWCCRCIILRIFLQVGRPRLADGSPGPSRLGGQGVFCQAFSLFFTYLENKGNTAQKKRYFGAWLWCCRCIFVCILLQLRCFSIIFNIGLHPITNCNGSSSLSGDCSRVVVVIVEVAVVLV